MRYRAKKNILVLAILWLVYLGPLVLTVFLLIQRADPVGIFFGFFIIVVVDGLLLLVTSPSYYEITPAFLCARIGIMRVDIPLEAIQQVVAERTLGKPGGLSLA